MTDEQKDKGNNIPKAPAKQDVSSSPKKRGMSWVALITFLVVLIGGVDALLNIPRTLISLYKDANGSKVVNVVTDDSSKKAEEMVQPLSGFIREGNNHPLSGVTVSLPQYGLTSITDDFGRFEFNVKAARQESVDLMAQKEGYMTYDAFATLGNRGVSFTMEKEAQ